MQCMKKQDAVLVIYFLWPFSSFNQATEGAIHVDVQEL